MLFPESAGLSKPSVPAMSRNAIFAKMPLEGLVWACARPGVGALGQGHDSLKVKDVLAIIICRFVFHILLRAGGLEDSQSEARLSYNCVFALYDLLPQ